MFSFHRISSMNKKLSNYINQSTNILIRKYKRACILKPKVNFNYTDCYTPDDNKDDNKDKYFYYYTSFVSLVTFLIGYKIYNNKTIKQ